MTKVTFIYTNSITGMCNNAYRRKPGNHLNVNVSCWNCIGAVSLLKVEYIYKNSDCTTATILEQLNDKSSSWYSNVNHLGSIHDTLAYFDINGTKYQ